MRGPCPFMDRFPDLSRELREVCCEVDSAGQVPDCAENADVLSLELATISLWALHRALGYRNRLAGNLDRALLHEADANRIYLTISDSVRW